MTDSHTHNHWTTDAKRWYKSMTESERQRAADLLGVPVRITKRLLMGYSASERATTWPVRDANENIVSARYICLHTRHQRSPRSACDGLIYPIDLPLGQPLWVTNGPAETAACLSQGLAAVGIPLDGARADWVLELAARLVSPELIVLANATEPGSAFVHRLARQYPVRILTKK